jgi:hypothetical protein
VRFSIKRWGGRDNVDLDQRAFVERATSTLVFAGRCDRPCSNHSHLLKAET